MQYPLRFKCWALWAAGGGAILKLVGSFGGGTLLEEVHHSGGAEVQGYSPIYISGWSSLLPGQPRISELYLRKLLPSLANVVRIMEFLFL